MTEEIIKSSLFEDAIKVTRNSGKLSIEISEAGILEAAKYQQWEITDSNIFLNSLAEKICNEESNDGFEDTLLIFKFIDNLINELGESASEGIELIED